MKKELTNENIQSAVEYVTRFMESNNVAKKEIRRQTLMTEQLLLLYGEQESRNFTVDCFRRKNRIFIRLTADGEPRNFLEPGGNIIIDNLIAGMANPPVWSMKSGRNTVTLMNKIDLPGFRNLIFIPGYLKKSKLEVTAALTSQLLMIAANIVIPVLTAKIVTAISDSEIIRIILVAVALSVSGVLCYLFDYISTVCFGKMYARLLNELETDLSKRVLSLEDATMNEYGSGMFIQRMVDDTENLACGFNSIMEALSYIIQCIGIIIAVSFISPGLCIYFTAVAILSVVLELKRVRRRGQDDRAYRRNKEHYTSFVSEMIHGAKDIKLQNSKDVFIAKLSRAIAGANDERFKMEKTSEKYVFLRKGTKELCDLGLYVILALMLAKNALLPSAALIIVNYNLSVSSIGWFFGEFMNEINTLTVSAERVFKLLYSPDYREEKFGALCPDTFLGNIELKNVSFSYEEGRLMQKSNMVLKEISFSIRQGEKIALVGKSGSGKTTVFNLLTGLYKPISGMLTLDGADYNTLSADYIRSNIAVVSQRPYVFNMTVRENLDLAGENITLDRMEKVCKASNIYADIMKMPEGFDTVLGEGGVRLSGGQSQRLAIARCLLKNCRLILLDEATSALDNVTQNEVVENIKKYCPDCTVVTIAHRMSTIINSDRILLLDGGRISAQGTHNELMAKSKAYRELYQSEGVDCISAEG